MSGLRISKRLVDALKPQKVEHVVWDSELTGFGVRVRPTGHMTYILQYRAGTGRGAPTKKLTIGAVGKLTPEDARAIARRSVGAVMSGLDPAQEKAGKSKSPRFDQLAEAYLTEFIARQRKPSTAKLYRHNLSHARSAWGHRKAVDIARADVSKLHREIATKTPVLANRVLATLSAMYSWADQAERIPEAVNPARKIQKFPEQGKERFLSADEYLRLGEALDLAAGQGIPWEPHPDGKLKHAPKADKRRVKFDVYVISAIRLFLFTGARLREILCMRWEHFDPDRGVVLLPDSKTGKKTLVLSQAAIAVIESLPRAGDYIIAGKTPAKPRADLKRPWERIRSYAGLGDVRLHDLRHSFASVGVGGGYGLPIVGKLLGHTQSSTTQKYAHLDTEPVRRVTNEIGRRIADAIEGGSKARPFAHAAERTSPSRAERDQ